MLIPFAEVKYTREPLFRLFLDISKAKHLRRVKFISQNSSVEWIAAALETLAHDQGQVRITIDLHLGSAKSRANHHRLVDAIGPTVHEEWMALDKLIVRLWESNTIQTFVRIYEPWPEDQTWKEEWMPTMLPGAWGKGAVCRFRLTEWYRKAPFMAVE